MFNNKLNSSILINYELHEFDESIRKIWDASIRIETNPQSASIWSLYSFQFAALAA